MNILENAQRLPVLDWNITFFGGHEQKVSNNWIVPLNQHQAFELIYVINGIEKLKLEKRNIIISKNEFVIIPPGFKHTCYAVKNLKYFCFHFDIDDPNFVVQLIQNSPIYFPKSHPLNNKLIHIFDKMDQLITRNQIYSFEDKMKLQIYFSQVLLFLNILTEHNTHEATSNKSKYAKLIFEKIKTELNDYVLYQTNYTSNSSRYSIPKMPKISTIIESLQISPGYGNRIFKEVYGISPRRYLSKLKIKWAQQMLTKPQLTISEIASALGYQNPSHFSRQFKRWTGISPNKYR